MTCRLAAPLARGVAVSLTCAAEGEEAGMAAYENTGEFTVDMTPVEGLIDGTGRALMVLTR